MTRVLSSLFNMSSRVAKACSSAAAQPHVCLCTSTSLQAKGRASSGRRSTGSSRQQQQQQQTSPSQRQPQRTFEQLIQPSRVGTSLRQGGTDVGHDLTGKKLTQKDIASVLANFSKRPEVRALASEQSITDELFMPALKEFRTFCMESSPLPAELHVAFSDILSGQVSVDELFPHFLAHAHRVYPHLECMADLQVISDLREPHSWFAEARMLTRKVFFHAGPTNSGKTYKALKRMMEAKSGVYCGPLRLLASEVFHKCNEAGVPCDLVTGEDRRFAKDADDPSAHLSCTVEMLNTSTAMYEVAVIDEIQMIRDSSRGWAWTRALLGVCAEEVHVCGEPAAISLVRRLLAPCGEEVHSYHYDRMTPLHLSDKAAGSLSTVKAGDCIVCFGRRQIFQTCQAVEAEGHEVAVIYGALPPSTKLAQAARFNDPNDPCNVLVATDAIGMGLNLSINRVVFTELSKPDDYGRKTLLTPAHAKQIGGRAGRFGTLYEGGEVTTVRPQDLPVLHSLFNQEVVEDEQAGICPTLEQMEMFSFNLPHASLPTLFDLFESICAVDGDKYFMCNLDELKRKAKMIEHVKLPLKVMYTFVQSPVKPDMPFICAAFVRFARRFASGQPLTAEWLAVQIGGWPQAPVDSVDRLKRLEQVFDVTDLYLWLGQRYMDMFTDEPLVREMQAELDLLIRDGIRRIGDLLREQHRATQAKSLHRLAYKRPSELVDDELDGDTEGVEGSPIPSSSRAQHTSINIDLGDDVPLITRQMPPPKARAAQQSIEQRLLASGKLTKWELDKLKSELGGRLKQRSKHEDD